MSTVYDIVTVTCFGCIVLTYIMFTEGGIKVLAHFLLPAAAFAIANQVGNAAHGEPRAERPGDRSDCSRNRIHLYYRTSLIRRGSRKIQRSEKSICLKFPSALSQFPIVPLRASTRTRVALELRWRSENCWRRHGARSGGSYQTSDETSRWLWSSLPTSSVVRLFSQPGAPARARETLRLKPLRRSVIAFCPGSARSCGRRVSSRSRRPSFRARSRAHEVRALSSTYPASPPRSGPVLTPCSRRRPIALT